MLRRHAPDLRVLQHVAPAAVASIAVVWAWLDGGFTSTTWYAGGLVVAALLVTQILGGAVAVGRAPMIVAVGFLGSFAAFEGLSILWASSKGDAWDAANLTFIYAFILLLFAGWRAAVPARQVLVALFAVAMAGVGVLTLFSAAGDVTSAFIVQRLAAPTGYPNATAALFLIPFFPAVALGATPRLAVPIRAVAVGSAATLACVAYVPESRGALYTFPLACVLLLALARSRIRMAVTLLVAVAPALLLIHPLSRPYEVAGEHLRAAATHHAANLALLSGVAAAAAGAILAAADTKIRFTPPRWLNRVGYLAAAAAVVSAVAFAAAHHPTATARHLWSSFRSDNTASADGSTRFGSLGSNRYDFWRVSLDLAEAHPLVGIGAGNFGEEYLQHRRTNEQPAFPHSIEMSVLSETGAIGTILFLLFGVFAVLAVGRSRQAGGATAALAAGGATAFGYWVLHGSVDWLWQFPALGASAFMMLGIAAGPSRPGRIPWKATVAAAVLTAAIAATFVAPWIAAKQVARASEVWRSDPALAYSALDQAATLNPLSDAAPAVEGTIAAERGDLPRMRTSFERAVSRDPNDWFSRIQLAVALARQHQWRAAERSATDAADLNPREKTIPAVLASIHAHRRIPLRAVNDAVLNQLQTLAGGAAL